MTTTFTHPLRALTRGLGWRRIALTCVIAITVAALLCVPSMSLASFPRFLVASGVFAAALMLALTVTSNLRSGKVSPVLLNLAAVAVACVVGVIILSAMQGMDLARELTHSAGRQGVASTLAIGLAIGAAMAFVMALRERQAGDRARHEARESLLQRQVLESQLRLLQAQVEPHFLFNTLAHVQRLVTIDAPAALVLLENLSQYLRAALPDMRERHSTVGREVDMAQAYLSIMRTRMGERLQFTIDVPATLRAAEFPPMMLLSLVETRSSMVWVMWPTASSRSRPAAQSARSHCRWATTAAGSTRTRHKVSAWRTSAKGCRHSMGRPRNSALKSVRLAIRTPA